MSQSHIDKNKGRLRGQIVYLLDYTWVETKRFSAQDIRRPERMPTTIKLKKGKGNG